MLKNDIIHSHAALISFMSKSYLLSLCLLFATFTTSAKKVIEDLDFDTGDWALIGVPLHNYKSLPIQRDLGTFITKDRAFMQQIQQSWDLALTFEDKCDYHYALKFYREGELINTIKLNLHCGYLTSDGFSYSFNPSEFERFKQHAKPISWSRISFGDLDLLKKAIQRLDKTKGVYWYEDIDQYRYPGYFMLSVNGLPWSSNLDSLHTTIQAQIQAQVNSDRFYLKKYYHVFRYDYIHVRYIVNCEESLAKRVEMKQALGWRSHLAGRDSVRIVAIGVDEQKYWKIMDKK